MVSPRFSSSGRKQSLPRLARMLSIPFFLLVLCSVAVRVIVDNDVVVVVVLLLILLSVAVVLAEELMVHSLLFR